MNRRTARTNADVLEVLQAWFDAVQEDQDNTTLEKDTITIRANSPESDALLNEVNARLAAVESPCIALPGDLTSRGCDSTVASISDRERKRRESTVRSSLTRIAIARRTLYGHSPDDIEKMGRDDLEALRRRTCSTENHGVPFISKCLYHATGSGKYTLDPDTMKVFADNKILEKVTGEQGAYVVYTGNKNASGALGKRMLELRDLALTEKERRLAKAEKEEREAKVYEKKAVKRKAVDSAAPEKKKVSSKKKETKTSHEAPVSTV